jgi:hypothetical protein
MTLGFMQVEVWHNAWVIRKMRVGYSELDKPRSDKRGHWPNVRSWGEPDKAGWRE